jgi:hypothetical protein
MATDLEAVAKWHESKASDARREGDEFFHADCGAAIRAAMGEIDRLREFSKGIASMALAASEVELERLQVRS